MPTPCHPEERMPTPCHPEELATRDLLVSGTTARRLLNCRFLADARSDSGKEVGIRWTRRRTIRA